MQHGHWKQMAQMAEMYFTNHTGITQYTKLKAIHKLKRDIMSLTTGHTGYTGIIHSTLDSCFKRQIETVKVHVYVNC